MIETILYLLAGAVAGCLIGGLAVWARLAGRAAQAGELEKKNEEQQAQLGDYQQRVTDLTGELRAQETSAQRIPALEEELHKAAALAAERGEEIARLTTTIQKERQALQEKQALLDESRTKLSDAFGALAADALRQNSESFYKIAAERFTREREAAQGELEKRQQAIGELVAPLHEQLTNAEKLIQEMERRREGAYEGLVNQVKTLDATQMRLGRETYNLVRALRTPNVRGRWGEITLKRTAELAGMVEHCDFIEQTSADTEDGRRRPDMIVTLPGGGKVIIDSKTPMEGYLAALEADNDEKRVECLKRHAAQLRTHIEDLANKAYWAHFGPAPEFTVMFLIGEHFLTAALEYEPDLLERGFNKHVVLATPSTLVSLLRTVEMGWRQEQMTQNTKKIEQLGRELYERLATMTEHLERLGSSIQSSVKNYNQAVRSLERRVLPAARRFPPLGISNKKEIPNLKSIDETTHPLLFEMEGSEDLFDQEDTEPQTEQKT